MVRATREQMERFTWDGKSRVPSKQYKENYDAIFGKKKKAPKKSKPKEQK